MGKYGSYYPTEAEEEAEKRRRLNRVVAATHASTFFKKVTGGTEAKTLAEINKGLEERGYNPQMLNGPDTIFDFFRKTHSTWGEGSIPLAQRGLVRSRERIESIINESDHKHTRCLLFSDFSYVAITIPQKHLTFEADREGIEWDTIRRRIPQPLGIIHLAPAIWRDSSLGSDPKGTAKLRVLSALFPPDTGLDLVRVDSPVGPEGTPLDNRTFPYFTGKV